MEQTFNDISLYLKEEEKHFHKVTLWSKPKESSLGLFDLFADITFDIFEGRGFSNPNNSYIFNCKTFEKSAQTITEFDCLACDLNKYSLLSISRFPNLKMLAVNLIETEISNMFSNGSNIKSLILSHKSDQEIIIRTKAFANLTNLQKLDFQNMNIKKFQNGSLDFNAAFNPYLNIIFSHLNLNGDSFEDGTFGNTIGYSITFINSTINYIPESIFKNVLDRSSISFEHPFLNLYKEQSLKYFYSKASYIDCDDCRNYWLIKHQKEKQVQKTICKGTDSTGLFDYETISKLNTKCYE